MKKLKLNRRRLIIFVILILASLFLVLGSIRTNYWRLQKLGTYKIAGDKARSENNLSLAVLNYKKALALSPFNHEVASAIGETYNSVGEYEKALYYYKKIKNSYEIFNKIGDIYYEIGDFNQSNKYYQKSTSTRSNSYAYLGIGKCALKSGDLDKASEGFKEAFKVDSSSREAHFYLTLVLAFKSPEEAKKESNDLKNQSQDETNLKKAISNINDDEVLYGKTILANLFNNLGFPKSAILVIEPEIKENTTYRDVFLVLANIYLQLKDYDKAIQTANKAVELDTIYIPSYELLSQIYKEKGDSKKSQEYLDKIAALEIR